MEPNSLLLFTQYLSALILIQNQGYQPVAGFRNMAAENTIDLNVPSNSGNVVKLRTLNYFPQNEASLTRSNRIPGATIGNANPVELSASEQSVTLEEVVGPFNTSLNVVAPVKFTEADVLFAQAFLDRAGEMPNINMPMALPQFPTGESSVQPGVMVNLALDYALLDDRTLSDQMMTTSLAYNPDGKSDGSTLITDSVDLADLQNVVQLMRKAGVPTYPDGYYRAAITPEAELAFMQDSDFKAAAIRYANQMEVRKGEIVEWNGVRLWRTNNLKPETVNTLTSYTSLVYGPQSCGSGQGQKPVQVYRHTDTDYDRNYFFMWREFNGYSPLKAATNCYKLRHFVALS